MWVRVSGFQGFQGCQGCQGFGYRTPSSSKQPAPRLPVDATKQLETQKSPTLIAFQLIALNRAPGNTYPRALKGIRVGYKVP